MKNDKNIIVNQQNKIGLSNFLLFVIIIFCLIFIGFYFKNKPQFSNTEEKLVKEYYYDLLHLGKKSKDGFYVIDFNQTGKSPQSVYYATDSKFMFDNLKNDEKAAIILNNMSSIIQKFNCDTSSTINEISIEEFSNTYKYLFGDNKINNIKTFTTEFQGTCKINESSSFYECETWFDGIRTCGEELVVKFDKYEIDNDNLYIYEKGLIRSQCEDKTYPKSLNPEDTSENEEIFGKTTEEVFNNDKYAKYLSTYKFHLKKNSDESYYLYSVEKISK